MVRQELSPPRNKDNASARLMTMAECELLGWLKHLGK